MAGEKFHFIFSEEPNKKYFIDEPINYSDVDFVLEQKENRMGRDESLNGGENRFRFDDYSNHYIEKLFYYYHKYGFEADILLVITTINGFEYVSELHFVDVDTDEITYLECRTITRSSQQIIKSRRETKVDMFSNVSIDGEFIEPLVPVNMLLQAKPTIQTSRWEQVTPSQDFILPFSPNYFNLTQALIESGIEDSYVPFMLRSQQRKDFQILEAQSNLKNVVLNITKTDIDLVTSSSGQITARIQYIKTDSVVDNSNPTSFVIYSYVGGTTKITQDFTVSIGDMQRGEKLYLFMQASTNGGSSVKINTCNVTLSTQSTSYNSITPSFRLIDVMRQIVKSISGNEVLSKRYDYAGQFYDNVLFNGNLMRSETSKPFYVSLADIEDSIWAEHKGDSEINEDGSVFFGIERDFYTDIECGFFDDTQFEDMVKNTNQKYALNEFKFKYGKYQSLKENTEPNSESTIHGESIWTFYNRRAPNKLEANVEWVRDAVLIDAQQRLATKISKDTATQDDDTIFCMDVIDTTEDKYFTETTNLQHTAEGVNLSLRSNGDVNFVALGIKPFTIFVIDAPNVNAGTYNVLEVNPSELKLNGVTVSDVNNGIKLTKYTYQIKVSTIPLTNRTNEGFTAISNLLNPERYSNLRYSVKRNILNYWNSTLATVNLFWKDKPIQNTYYKNNSKCDTTYAGLNVIEGKAFIPDNPILSPYIYKNLTYVNVDYEDYIILRDKIKKDRGFIRGINQNKRVLRVYPTKITYVNSGKKLIIDGEEKFEKAYLTISNENGVVLVNNETRMMRLIWEFDVNSQEIVLFDRERFRLYNGVVWDKVSVNGAVANTKEELFSWLRLLE